MPLHVLPPTSHHKTRATLLPMSISIYAKSLLPSTVMGAFSSHLAVPGVPAARQVPVIPVDPALAHPEDPAGLAVLGGQGHLQGNRDTG